MAMSLEEMYKLALNPKLFPDQRLLAVMQGRDTSIPMAVAMSAKQMRDKEATAAKGAQAQAQAAQPSIRDQMLAKGMQQHMAGLDQLHAPTMESMGEEGMAGGGLVSFAVGGMNDPDEETDPEQDDLDELDAMMAQQGDLGGLGAGIMAVANPAAAKYSSFTKPGISPSSAPGQFKDIAADAAKRHGASWDLVQHVMKKETGGSKDAAHAVSSKGATGVMQLMPATAKELGVKNINDPHENINAGVKYIAQLEKQFKDPKLAAMAYNWGPGNVKKWLAHGAKENAVPKETRMYVASLAQGGIVNLAGGSKEPVQGDDEGYFLPPTEAAESEFGRDIQLLSTRQKNKMQELKNKIKEVGSGITGYFGKSEPGAYGQEPELRTPVKTSAVDIAPVTVADTSGAGGDNTGANLSAPTAPVDPFAASQKRVDDYLANLAQQRKQDQGLAAILGGATIAGAAGPLSSALAKGAQTGVGYLGESQKGYNTAMAQGLGAQGMLDRNRMLKQHYDIAGQQGLSMKYSGMLQKYTDAIDKEIAGNAVMKNNPTQASLYRQNRLRQLISADPNMSAWYTANGGDISPPSALSDTPVGTVRTLPKS